MVFILQWSAPALGDLIFSNPEKKILNLVYYSQKTYHFFLLLELEPKLGYGGPARYSNSRTDSTGPVESSTRSKESKDLKVETLGDHQIQNEIP